MKCGQGQRTIIAIFGVALIASGLIGVVTAGTVCAAELDALEQRLLDAADVRFDFDITADGAIETSLRGRLEIAPDGVRLDAQGTFGGASVDLSLRSDRGRLELGNGPDELAVPTPPNLKEALVIGLTRMGVLHNLARLIEAAPPDHADGGVREWVTVTSVEGEAAGPDAMSFDLIVAGEPAGSATLAVDSRGRPTVRRQTVEFSSGRMQVVERYSAFSIAPE